VLVIAPDLGLRRSLEFALEVEGFAVLTFDDVNAALSSPSTAQGSCVVIDEEALLNDPSAMAAMERLHKPVILLADRSLSIPDVLGIRMLRKPLLGNALITAVRLTDQSAGAGQST
jgi:DNA-binding response OmpR family regulator